ncbi:MarR family winged helix-turn-helix transcriptional regulator [Litorimonas sp.]|uniref:MarR family winged helix-turn-helix transcriptional regulator n=1 Tax=Litorimonas sp. TaxID=1892381 RepID=UPI003A85F74A
MPSRSEDALISLRQILLAVEVDSRFLAKQSALNPSQFILLQLLHTRNKMTPSEIARDMSLAHATVSTLTDKLKQAGLIKREVSVTDKRSQTISLTDLGRQTLLQAPDILQRRFETGFKNISEERQQQMISVLGQISVLLGAENIDAAPLLDVGPATDLSE